MATYEIYKKDGTPVRVQGPPNLSFEQVLSIYERDKPKQPSQSEQRAPVTLPKGFSEATWGDRAGELFKGIGGGALTFFEQGLEGTSQLFPEKQEQWLREKIGSGIGSLRDKYTQKDMWQEVALQNADAGFDVPWEDVIPRKFGEALGSLEV